MTKDEQLRIIGGKIRHYRKTIGLTGEQLGHATGVGRTGISKIEKGKINVTIGTLMIICYHLKINLNNLI